MKKTAIFKRVAALFLAAQMALSLAACRDPNGSSLTTKDAQKCVQVELDTTYKGKFDGFVDFYSNVTTSDAKEQYDYNIEGEALNFLYSLGPVSLEDQNSSAEPSEMQLHRAKELYKQIYAKADYSIVSSSKQDDGTFAVKVNIKPVDVLTPLVDGYDDGFADFDAKFSTDEINDYVDSLSDDEFADWYIKVYVAEFYDALLDLLESSIPNMTYKDEKSIVIQVQQDEDGALLISDQDWYNLDALILDYSGE